MNKVNVLKKILNTIWTLIKSYTEVSLLLFFCFGLVIWFQFSGIKKPTEQTDSTFLYSKHLGSKSFNANNLPSVSLENLCKNSASQPQLSNEVKQRCQLIYPDDLAYVDLYKKVGLVTFLQNGFKEPLLPPLTSDDIINKKMESAYNTAQTGFQSIARHSKNMPSSVNAFAFDSMKVRRNGSLPLQCSWSTIHSLYDNKNINANERNLLLTELFIGGYAPYNRFADHRVVRNDRSVGMVILSGMEWGAVANAQVRTQCAEVGFTPADVYLHTMKDLQRMYMYRNYQGKTAKMDILSQKAHFYFIWLVFSTYLCLLIIRRNMSMDWTIPIVSATVVANYFAINTVMGTAIVSSTHLIMILAVVAFLFFVQYFSGIFIYLFESIIKVFASLPVVGRFFKNSNPVNYQLIEQGSVKLSKNTSFTYPALVLIAGVGYFVLLAWSINSGYDSNMFLALYQSSFLYLFFSLLGLAGLLYTILYQVIYLGVRLFRSFKEFTLSVIRNTNLALKKQAPVKSSNLLKKVSWLLLLYAPTNIGLIVLFFMLPLILLAITSFILPSQAVSVVTRTAVLLFIAYFLSQSTHREQSKLFSEANFLIILSVFLALCVQVAGSDFGPVMILSYALLILLISELSVFYLSKNKQHKMSNSKHGANLVSIVIPSCVVIVCLAIFFSFFAEHINFRSMERVMSMNVPFSSTNDQRAMLLYFIDSVPDGGYGLGHTAWQGDYRGVPAQTQSDYFPMALYGVLGANGLVAVVALYVGFLLSLCLPWLRALSTKMTGAFEKSEPIIEMKNFYAWAVVLWSFFTLTQVCLSIMGNFGVTPLTGITLPLFSYGWVELAVSGVMIGVFLYRCEEYSS